jgi:hypothetical protein
VVPREIAAVEYQRRTPEDSLLYRVVQENLETFLAEAAQRDRCVPAFVEREFRKFLECGLLCHGFVRVRCKDCGDDKLVAFSCQRRGFCPSCCGRRMSDTAAHLVDRVFPEVPTRQWVLTLPIPLRYRVAYDRTLCSDVLGVFIGTVLRSLRQRAKKHLGIDHGQSGSVTQIQRWGGAANLNVHFHSVFLDGVYADPNHTGKPEFFSLPAPDDEEIARVAAASARGIIRLLERRGLLSDHGDAAEDPLQDGEPLLAAALLHESERGCGSATPMIVIRGQPRWIRACRAPSSDSERCRR